IQNPNTRLTTSPPHCRNASTTFPTTTAGWAATTNNGRVIVDRTADQGRHWNAVHVPALITNYQPTTEATDAEHAWLLAAELPNDMTELYVTSDGGHTWQRTDERIS
ncbi:MAG TPA: hypothetical protein VK816_02280, partial [Jatrophihabitantaceae bacterium]|nr:hypothetical protein [Jatrophihabitantaceae bacterium]